MFGTDDNILDVPRDVTIISREQMDTIGIQDVTEFSKLTSSSYTDSNFGAPGNPSIRGQSADLFVNGMRQRVTSNGNGMPVDFNSIESVNIVKGPATAVQGASAYVGGFADTLCLEVVEQLADLGCRFAFEMNESDNDIGYLHAGVINVVLHIDFLPGGAEQSAEGIAKNGVAQVADMRGLVGIDARVLD